MASSLTMWQPKQISLWLNCKDFLKLVINIEQLSLLSYRVCTSPHTRGGGGEELWVGKMGVMLLSCSPVLCCRLLVPAAAGGWFQLRRGSTKAVGIRDKHPEAKGYWVRNLNIPDLGPWNFDTGKPLQVCSLPEGSSSRVLHIVLSPVPQALWSKSPTDAGSFHRGFLAQGLIAHYLQVQKQSQTWWTS